MHMLNPVADIIAKQSEVIEQVRFRKVLTKLEEQNDSEKQYSLLKVFVVALHVANHKLRDVRKQH